MQPESEIAAMHLRSFNRFQAAALHLCFSLLLALLVFCLFRFLWYPDGLFGVAAAGKLLLLVTGVDVVIGPLLTLVVFNPKKKNLPFDLAVIAVLQVSALAYGVQVMLDSRPIFLVGVTDRFELVMANELADADLAKATQPEFGQRSWTGPVLVGAKRPASSAARSQLLFDTLEGKSDLDRRPEYYVPYSEISADLLKRGTHLSHWGSVDHPEVKRALAYVRQRQLDPGQVLVLPLKTRLRFAALLIDPAAGKPLRAFDFDPYEVHP